jgi:hypothetical protein
MTTPAPSSDPLRRVQLWLGEHLIADFRADASLATRYAQTMTPKFAGVRITNDPYDPAAPELSGAAEPLQLPHDARLWPITAL